MSDGQNIALRGVLRDNLLWFIVLGVLSLILGLIYVVYQTQQSFALYGLGVFILLYILLEVGYRIGAILKKGYFQSELPTTSVGFILGGMFALLAFLIGSALTIAISEYHQRASAVLAEARSIGSAWQVAGALPAGAGQDIREALREYTEIRINAVNEARTGARDFNPAQNTMTMAKQAEIWATAEAIAKTHDSRISVLQLDGLNQAFSDALSQRTVSSKQIPDQLRLLILFAAIVTIAATGLYMGVLGPRLFGNTTLLLLLFTGTAVLVVDISRPHEGTIRISAQPLIWTLEGMGKQPSSPVVGSAAIKTK
ncbi:MAG: hypothetical protein ACR2PG_27840 [Hyphomicrobiaceae bacterium]